MSTISSTDFHTAVLQLCLTEHFKQLSAANLLIIFERRRTTSTKHDINIPNAILLQLILVRYSRKLDQWIILCLLPKISNYAERGIAAPREVVCPSVRPHVTLMDCDHRH